MRRHHSECSRNIQVRALQFSSIARHFPMMLPRRRNPVKLAKTYIAGIAFQEWMQRQQVAVTMSRVQGLWNGQYVDMVSNGRQSCFENTRVRYKEIVAERMQRLHRRVGSIEWGKMGICSILVTRSSGVLTVARPMSRKRTSSTNQFLGHGSNAEREGRSSTSTHIISHQIHSSESSFTRSFFGCKSLIRQRIFLFPLLKMMI